MMRSIQTWNNPDEFVRARLAALGAGQRSLAFVFDPESLLQWPEDGSASISDARGVEWRLLSYRGNDMGLRARLMIGQPTVIWVRPRLSEAPDPIDLTTLADLVALADAFVDVSVAGMLNALLPGVSLPSEVATWAPQASSDPSGFARALRRILDYKGKPVSRRHVLAAAICQATAKASPELAWLDDSDLPSLLTSYVHLLSADRSDRLRVAAGAAFKHVASLVAGQTTLRPSELATLVVSVPAETLVDYMYVLAAARRHAIHHPTSTLANHGLSPNDISSLLAHEPALVRVFVDTADRLNGNSDALRAVAQEAERRVDAPRFRQLQSLLRHAAANWTEEPAAAVRLALLSSVVDESDGKGTFNAPPADVVPPVGSPKFVRAAQALRNVASVLVTHEEALANSSSAASIDLEGLVAAYTERFATIEFDVNQARRDLATVVSVLGNQKKLDSRLDALMRNAEEVLQSYEKRLAHVLRNSPDQLERSSLALRRWLISVVVPRMKVEPHRRVWILVFDGLRWDLWERVLRPELEQAGWEVNAKPGLALLPTETSICRRVLLSGRMPGSWGNAGSIPSEESLLREFFLKRADTNVDLIYRLRAEEGAGSTPVAGTGNVNVWVYRIPDRQSHLVDGTLYDVVLQFRAYLQNNVLPELRSEIGPEDLVFVGADHGFIRVRGDDKCTVPFPKERVKERFIELEPGDDITSLPGLEVHHPGLGRWLVATDNVVYAPISGVVPASSFRHGGATLREMVVPLAELRLPVRSVGKLEIELEGPPDLREDSSGQYVVRLKNATEDAIGGQLLFETELETVSRLPLNLAPGAQAERRYTIVGHEGMNWVRARLVSGTVTLAAKTITVKIELKPGVKLQGLEALDDDL